MHKIQLMLITLLVTFNVFSQEDYIQLPNAKTQGPTYIFNKNNIGNANYLQRLGNTEEERKEKIKEVSVLMEKPNKEECEYYNLTSQGILFVDLKEIPKSKTQAEIKAFFGLEEATEIYIDGYLLESKKYSIALEGTTEIEIVEPDEVNGLKSKALNIWTLSKEERYSENTN